MKRKDINKDSQERLLRKKIRPIIKRVVEDHSNGESKIREALRKYIRNMMEGADTQAAPAVAPKTPAPKPQPSKPAPSPAPSEPKTQPKKAEPNQQGAKEDVSYTEVTNQFIRRLKSSAESVELQDVVEIASMIISTFAPSSEARLEALKSIKSSIVH